jgi:hypothetical protein
MRANRRCRLGTSTVLVPTVLIMVAACSGSATPGPSATAGEPSATEAGPGSSPTAESAPPGATSCTVITQAEAGAALGQSVKPPVRGRAIVEGGTACVYYGPNAPAGANPDVAISDSVRVVLVNGPNAEKYFDDYRSKVKAQPIAGLGDDAYYDGFASISVLKGDAYVRIAVIGVPDVLSADKALAADAMPRI